MIELIDIQPRDINGVQKLTVEQRKSILARAMNSVPMFNLLPYDIITGAGKEKQYKGRLDINLDYFLTEIRGNFREVIEDTDTQWQVNIYIAETGQSVYGFNKSQPLPTQMVMTDGNFTQTATEQRYDDRQREFMPFYVPRGNEVISEIVNVSAKSSIASAKILLCGYTLIKYPYINTQEQILINESLEDDSIYQTFVANVDNIRTKKAYNFNNDQRPRLILGFGVVDSVTRATGLKRSTISIQDTTRHLKLTNEPTPLELIAPRTPVCSQDTHNYFLPIEYYWMPQGNIRIEIENDSGQADYQLIMLTRTV